MHDAQLAEQVESGREAWIDLAEGYWKQFVWSPFK